MHAAYLVYQLVLAFISQTSDGLPNVSNEMPKSTFQSVRKFSGGGRSSVVRFVCQCHTASLVLIQIGLSSKSEHSKCNLMS
ncbi:hypothetical protein ACP70R_035609 [Stipagrostis hirtigluma subsp. patula]